MLKKTITYTDFNGETVSEDFYFHLSKAELIEMEMSYEGGLSAALQRLVAASDGKSIIAEFKSIILGSYGQKSLDGRRFIKSQELRDEFESTEAYSTLFMELVTDAEVSAAFVNGIIPQDMAEQVAKLAAKTSSEPGPVLTVAPENNVETNVREISRADFMVMSKEQFTAAQESIAAGEAVLVD